MSTASILTETLKDCFLYRQSLKKKDLASSQPKITVRPSTAQLFEIQLQLFEDVEEVFFPIWSEQDGQDDLIWYPAKRTAPGRYQLSFNAEKHKGKGTFHLHVYQKDKGHLKGLLATTFQVEQAKVAPLVTQPDNYYPLANVPGQQKSWLLGHKTGGETVACGLLALALQASG